MLEAQDNQISYNFFNIKRKGCNISSHLHGQHGTPAMIKENGILMKQKITITAEYLPELMNVEADSESRYPSGWNTYQS